MSVSLPLFGSKGLANFPTIKLKPLPPSKVVKLSTLEVVWRKVRDFIKWILRTIFFWKSPSDFRLNKRKIARIQEILTRRHSLEKKKVEVIPPQGPRPIDLEKTPPRLPLVVPKDKTLQGLCTFLEDFADVLIPNCLYEKKIKPAAPKWKESTIKHINELPQWTSLLVNTRNSIKSLYDHVSQIDSSLVTFVAQGVLKALLLAAGEEQTARENINKHLNDFFSKLVDTEEINPEQHEKILSLAKNAVDWLYDSNNWLINSNHPADLHKLLSDGMTFIDSLNSCLVDSEHPLNSKLDEIKKQITETFEADIKDFLHLNTKVVVAQLSWRLSELISELPFENAFKDVLKEALSQTEGWISSNKEQKKDRSLLNDAIKESKRKPKTAAEVEKQRNADDLLNTVTKDGGEEAYLEQQFLLSFAEHAACNKKIKELIEEQDPIKKKKIEEEICQEIAKHLLDHLLPEETISLPDGTQIGISGFGPLLDKISLSENFKKLERCCEEAFDIVVKNGKFIAPDNFKKYVFVLTKVISAKYIQRRAHDALTIGLMKFLDKLSSKEYLDELFGERILAALINKTFQARARQTMESKTKKLAPYFAEIIKSTDPTAATNEKFLAFLYTDMSKNQGNFKFDFAGIDEKKFDEILTPVIVDIYQFLIDKEKVTNATTEKEMTEKLDNYFKTTHVPNNPDYGSIIMKLLTEVGDHGGVVVWLAKNFYSLEHRISQASSNGMHNVSRSYHVIVSSIVSAASETFLNAAHVSQTFFGDPLDLEAAKMKRAETQKNLAKNIKNLSALTHDTLYPIVGWTATPSTATFEQQITKIFNNLFTRPTLNKSLILQVWKTLHEGFQTSEVKLNQKALYLRKIEEMEGAPAAGKGRAVPGERVNKPNHVRVE